MLQVLIEYATLLKYFNVKLNGYFSFFFNIYIKKLNFSNSEYLDAELKWEKWIY